MSVQGLDPRALSLSALRKAGLSLRDYAYVPDTPNYDTLKFKHSTLFDTDYDSTGIIAMTGAGAFALDTYDKAGVRFREVKVFVRNLN